MNYDKYLINKVMYLFETFFYNTINKVLHYDKAMKQCCYLYCGLKKLLME